MSRKRDITMLQKQIFQLNLEFKIGYIGWFPLLNAHYISRGPKLTMCFRILHYKISSRKRH